MYSHALSNNHSKQSNLRTLLLIFYFVFCFVIITFALLTAYVLRASEPPQTTTNTALSHTEIRKLNSLAINLVELEQYDAALSSLIYMASINKNSASLLINIGMAYKKKGDLRSARKYYTKALEIDPNNSIAFNNLGMLAAAENNPIAATYLLEKAITADPKNPDPYLNLAYILEKTGNKAQALKYFAMYLNFSTVNSKVSSKVSPNVSLMTKTLLYKRIRALEKTP